MTELTFIRHADAGDPAAWQGDDDVRPLSPKGEKQADRLGRFLAEQGFAPDAIITSPKLRALQTAQIVADRIGAAYSLDTRLAGGLSPALLETLLRDAGDPERPVVVGHDPDFSEMVAELCGASEMPMRKGGLARIDIDRPLAAGAGTLRWLVPPDLLKTGR
jgi:phosphohistidine phosphatase